MSGRLRISRRGDLALTVAAPAGAAVCVILTVAVASTHATTQTLGAVAFGVVAVWCFIHRRVDRTLVVLGLYLGLLDGYLKLRSDSSIITLARDVLVFAIAGGALLRTTRTTQPLHLPPLSGFIIAFSGVVFVELANPDSRGLVGSLGGVRQHLEFVPLFFLGYAFVRTESQIRRTLLVLVLCAAVGGVVSYIQSRLTPAQFAAWGPGYAQRILGTGSFTGGGRVGFAGGQATVRPFGLGSDAGSGAALAALALPGLSALLMTVRAQARWALVPMAIGIGLAVATSGSRAAIVTVVASLIAFGLIAAVSKNALKAIVGIALGTILIYAAFVQLGPNNATAQRAASITPGRALSTFSTEREGSVLELGSLVTNYPLGVGVGTVGPAGAFQAAPGSDTYNSETEWNFLVVEIGVAGLLIYVSFLLRLNWLALTRIRRVAAPSLRLYLAALGGPMFGMVVAGFSGPTSASVPTAPYLWLVAGVLSYSLVTAHRGAHASTGASTPGASGSGLV